MASKAGTGATIGTVLGGPVGGLIGAGVGAVANIFGSKKQASASNRAAAISSKTNTDALAYQREQDAIQKQQFDAQQAEARRQWDIQQANLQLQQQQANDDRSRAIALQDAKESRAVPYRQASQKALLTIGSLLNSGAATPGISAFQRPQVQAPLPISALMPRS